MQPHEHDVDQVAPQAAGRRAAFLRDELDSGRVPAGHPLARAYRREADRLEELFPTAVALEVDRLAVIAELDALFYRS